MSSRESSNVSTSSVDPKPRQNSSIRINALCNRRQVGFFSMSWNLAKAWGQTQKVSSTLTLQRKLTKVTKSLGSGIFPWGLIRCWWSLLSQQHPYTFTIFALPWWVNEIPLLCLFLSLYALSLLQPYSSFCCDFTPHSSGPNPQSTSPFSCPIEPGSHLDLSTPQSPTNTHSFPTPYSGQVPLCYLTGSALPPHSV